MLISYICDIYNIKIPHGMMLHQIKQYKDNYNYTNIGMYYTLKYFYEVMESKVLEDSGLGIMPYYYDKARKHYEKVFDLEDISENFNESEQFIKIKTKIIPKKIDIKNPLPLEIDWEEVNEDN